MTEANTPELLCLAGLRKCQTVFCCSTVSSIIKGALFCHPVSVLISSLLYRCEIGVSLRCRKCCKPYCKDGIIFNVEGRE